MATLHAYLNFEGNCEEAFQFYTQVFDAKVLGTVRFGDMPEDPNYPVAETDKHKIMNIAIMINENTMLLGSDCLESFQQKVNFGNSTYVMLDTESAEEAKNLFSRLSANAKVMEMELGETFWAEQFASFQDKFGIFWMINFEGNKKMEY